MTGFLDGINESLKGYENPIETMDENTQVKIEIDPEKLYYNMVEAKAEWLYHSAAVGLHLKRREEKRALQAAEGFRNHPQGKENFPERSVSVWKRQEIQKVLR